MTTPHVSSDRKQMPASVEAKPHRWSLSPWARAFRGLSRRSFDGRGNYSLGLREQIIFPEIEYDKVDKIRGLEIAIVTTAPDDAQGYALLKRLGMPFRD